jgi:hypothetical protein
LAPAATVTDAGSVSSVLLLESVLSIRLAAVCASVTEQMLAALCAEPRDGRRDATAALGEQRDLTALVPKLSACGARAGTLTVVSFNLSPAGRGLFFRFV